MGSQPGTRSGIPNGSAPIFPIILRFASMMAVVGIPVLILKMPPTCHPPTAAFTNPLADFGEGRAQSALMDAFWPTSKSERPRSVRGASEIKELRPLPNVSPAMVDELSSIDFAQV